MGQIMQCEQGDFRISIRCGRTGKGLCMRITVTRIPVRGSRDSLRIITGDSLRITGDSLRITGDSLRITGDSLGITGGVTVTVYAISPCILATFDRQVNCHRILLSFIESEMSISRITPSDQEENSSCAEQAGERGRGRDRRGRRLVRAEHDGLGRAE
jgi:hypothetical protein